MLKVTARGACARCPLFPKVGLPFETCANLCGARWRVAACRFAPAAAAELRTSARLLLFPLSAFTGPSVVPADVAGVARLHFGALPSARRALEVPLALFLLH